MTSHERMLDSFSSRHRAGRSDTAEWVRDNRLFAALRVGLPETVDYLLRASLGMGTQPGLAIERAVSRGL
jgi:hypothetical protein